MSYKNQNQKNHYKRYLIARNKLYAIEYKGGKCEECGYNKCIDALEFHHRNPKEKEFDWGDLRVASLQRIVKELNKCDILCSNCHKEKHINDFKKSREEALNYHNVYQRKHRTEEEKTGICPICKSKFKTRARKKKSITCSVLCQRVWLQKIDWPLNLPELVANSSLNKVSKSLKVSIDAVKKRLANHHF